jgi:hypothetical protein
MYKAYLQQRTNKGSVILGTDPNVPPLEEFPTASTSYTWLVDLAAGKCHVHHLSNYC